MNLNNLTRRVVSVAVAGAMALSLCAPALAAVPVNTSPEIALYKTVPTGTYTVTVKYGNNAVSVNSTNCTDILDSVHNRNMPQIALNEGPDDSYLLSGSNIAQDLEVIVTNADKPVDVLLTSSDNATGTTTLKGTFGDVKLNGGTVNELVVEGKAGSLSLPNVSGQVQITLNNAEINREINSTSQFSAITVSDASVRLTLEGTNILKGWKAIQSRGDLTIDGNGSLQAEGNYSNRLGVIHSSGNLTIEGGTIKVVNSNSAGSGLSGAKVTISGGSLDASGSTNGIRTAEEAEITGGSVKTTNISELGTEPLKVNLSGDAKVFLTSQNPTDNWSTGGLAGGWLLYDNGDGTVGGVPEGMNVNLNDLKTMDPANYSTLTPVVSYGITVNGVAVNEDNKDNIPVGNQHGATLTYDPTEHKLKGSGYLYLYESNGLNIVIVSSAAGEVDVELENSGSNGIAVAGGLDVTGAHNVTVTATDGTAISNGDVKIQNCTGNVEINGGAYSHSGSGSLTIGTKESPIGGNVTIYGEINGSYGADQTIYCDGEVHVENKRESNQISNRCLVIGKASKVELLSQANGMQSAEIKNCSGSVTITTNGAVAYGSAGLKVYGATDVTVTGNSSETLIPNGPTEITCSGKVTLTNKHASGSAVRNALIYNQSNGKSYTVSFDGVDSEPKQDTYNVSGASDKTLYSVKEIIITPDGWTDSTDEPVPDDTAISGGGDIGGAIAAVAVGGAAVWGGYEVATRVILNHLLPEGAAIPKTRGALALLVWQTAGCPEPANAPAFADVTGEQLAKAAQWCIEQGYMEAKADGSFKPESRTTKARVIQVWNKAFPKQ